jgi:hypothetical protein
MPDIRAPLLQLSRSRESPAVNAGPFCKYSSTVATSPTKHVTAGSAQQLEPIRNGTVVGPLTGRSNPVVAS